MLYNLLSPLAEEFTVFNLFKYITFRAGGAVLTSLIIGFIITPRIIRKLKEIQKEGQPIRKDGPKSHLSTKKGTPTMGGITIIIASILSSLLWINWQNKLVWPILFIFLFFGLLGFFDDYSKLKHKSSAGISAKLRLLLQVIACLVVYIWLNKITPPHLVNKLAIPFLKELKFDIGYFYLVFMTLVIIGSSNAVNLTDGLDGLVIVPTMLTSSTFAVISYLVGNQIFANYLQIPYVPGTGELTIFCGALIGASLVFLWYNAAPAEIFMGDTGSLSLGAAIGTISVITKNEFVLAITGGLFVIEALSVIIQVGYYKWSKGKRIFLMAPIHHHFEQKGWPETKVVVRFWIISIIFSLLALSTLKIR